MSNPLRYLALTLVVSLPLALAACGDSETTTTKPNSGTSTGSGAPPNQQDGGGVNPSPTAGNSSDPQSQQSLDALTAFAACMRKQGVDVRDPDPKDPPAILHALDQSDPVVARALPACQDKLAALNGGG